MTGPELIALGHAAIAKAHEKHLGDWNMWRQLGVQSSAVGIAVDTTRDIAWVTETSLNQVTGYQLTGGQPVRKYRLPTVRQPDSVAVDPVSGRVFVASADGGGVQVMQP